MALCLGFNFPVTLCTLVMCYSSPPILPPVNGTYSLNCGASFSALNQLLGRNPAQLHTPCRLTVSVSKPNHGNCFKERKKPAGPSLSELLFLAAGPYRGEGLPIGITESPLSLLRHLPRRSRSQSFVLCDWHILKLKKNNKPCEIM